MGAPGERGRGRRGKLERLTVLHTPAADPCFDRVFDYTERMSSLPPPTVVRLAARPGQPAGLVRRHAGRPAQPADVHGIAELDLDGASDRLRDLTGQIRALEAERMAVVAHWADLHAPSPEAELSGGKDAVTGERFLPAGPDGMVVSEFAAPTLGALIGVGSWAAASLIDDALNLRHRHPRLDALVKAGKVAVWQGRRVATATAKAELTDDDARLVDVATAADFARLPFDRAMEILEAELLRAASSTLAEQQRRAQEKKFARAYRSNDAGMKTFVAQLTAAEIARVDAMVTHLADRLLAMGDTRPVDVRRAVAFLMLADPASACMLLAGYAAPDAEAESLDAVEVAEVADDPATFVASDASHLDDAAPEPDEPPVPDRPNGPGAYGSWEFREDRAWPFTFGRQLDLFCPDREDDDRQESGTAFVVAAARAVGEALHALGAELGHKLWDRLRPRSVLYLHGWHEPGADGQVGGVIRSEVGGPLLAETAREWLRHDRVTVVPVVDTTDYLAADAYEVPAHIRESVRLRHPFEQFPHGRQASSTCDLDHLRPFQVGGPPGQSNTANLQPLGRRHHRTKTHSQWQVHVLEQGEGLRVGSLWRAPTGHWFLVDHLGTHDLGRPVDLPAELVS